MNKWINGLVTGLLLYAGQLTGQAPTFTVFPQNITAAVNEEFTVEIRVSNFTGIASIQYALSWNPAVLDFVSLDNVNSTALPGLNQNSFGLPGNGNVPAGRQTITWFDDTFSGKTLANNTVLYTLKLRGKANGTTNIAFTNDPPGIEILDANLNSVGLNPQNATVVVGTGGNNNSGQVTFAAGSTTGQVGQQVCIPVTVNDFNNISGFQFSISYDPAVLSFASVRNFNLTGLTQEAFGLPNTGNVPNGRITAAWFDNSQSTTGQSLANGTAIFELCFNITGGAGTTSNIGFVGNPTPIEVTNPNGQTLQFTGTQGAVTIPGGGTGGDGFALLLSDHTVSKDEEFCMQVTAQDFNSILGLQFSINYDPAQLQFLSVRNFNLAGLTESLFGLPSNGTTAGNITLSWFDSNLSGVTVADGTVLFEICFKATGGSGQTTVRFSNTPTGIEVTDSDEMTVPFNSDLGNVTFSTTIDPNAFALLLSDHNVQNGDQFCMKVTTQNFTDILGMQFSINYDPTRLRFESVRNFNLAGLTENLFGLPSNGTTAGNITLSWFDNSLSGVTVANGTTIFEICFTAIGSDGTTPVNFSGTPTSIEVTNADEQPVDFNSDSGIVTIGQGGGNQEGFRLIIEEKLVAPGQEICLGVSVQDFDNILGMQFSINYNASQLEFVSVRNFNLTGLGESQFGLPTSGGTTAGNITLSWFDNSLNSVTLPDGTKIFELCFRALAPNGTISTISFSGTPTAIEISDVNEMTVPFNSTPGKVTISAAGLPSIVNPVVITSVACRGASTGAINIEVQGGSGQYSYSWNYQNRTTQDLTGIPAGQYSVTVTDTETNFNVSATYTVMEPATAVAIGNISVNDVDCFGDNTGGIMVTATGGTGALTYTWNRNVPAGANPANLPAANDYRVTVTDANGCTAVSNPIIVPQPAAPVTVTPTVQNVECAGVPTGSISIQVSGGTPGYQYNWPGTLPDNVTSQSNLDAGQYTVSVTDSKGCLVDETISVNENAPVEVSGISRNDIDNGNDGAINITVSGGTGTYSYSWRGPNNYTFSQQDPINLSATGEYCVTITDGNGCRAERCVTLYNVLKFNNVQIKDACPGSSTGSINIQISGGLPPYRYSWSNGGNTSGISNVPGGTYVLQVTDEKGDRITGNFEVSQLPAISVNSQVTHDTEDPGCTGQIMLDVTGGRPGYTVQWNNGATGMQLNALCEGSYTPMITDANGCQLSGTPVVVNTFRLSAEITNTVCPDDETGVVNLAVSGGQTPYSVRWEDQSGNMVATTEDLQGVAPGTYKAIVMEPSGNTLTREYTITSTSDLGLSVAVLTNYNGFDVSCQDATDGSARATGLRGSGSFNYEWTFGDMLVGTQAVLSNAGPGVYEVTVIDGSGCEMTETVDLVAPPALVIDGNVKDVSCFGDGNGEIQANAAGGFPGGAGYRFQWSNNASGSRIAFLQQGNYTVTLTDGNNCQATRIFEVKQPEQLQVVIETEPATEDCNGTATAVATGGTPPFTYRWDPPFGQTSQSVMGLCPGDYAVRVVDSRGCTTRQGSVQAQVLDRRFPCTESRVVITPNGDDKNQQFMINCIEDLKDNHLEIYNRWGQLVFEADNYDNTWDGRTESGDELPDGPYYYILEFRDSNGNLQQMKGAITLLRN